MSEMVPAVWLCSDLDNVIFCLEVANFTASQRLIAIQSLAFVCFLLPAKSAAAHSLSVVSVVITCQLRGTTRLNMVAQPLCKHLAIQ